MTDNVGLNFQIVDTNFTVSQTYAATTNLVVIHSLGPLIDTSWLTNLLLHDISYVNILEFNINVSSFLSPKRFEQQAAKFLKQLANYLSLQAHSPRPSDIYKVAQLSRAILFLGTPLHGSIDALEAYVENFFCLYETLSSDQKFTTDPFLRQSPQHQLAPYLQQVQREFNVLHRKYTSNLRCVSFFEGLQEQNNSVVVRNIPACNPADQVEDLCHFSRPDPSYRLLLGELKKHIIAPNLDPILRESPQESLQLGTSACLDPSAALLTTQELFDSQQIHTAEQLYSFSRTPLFERWIADTQSSSILWLHGKPGCGKTTLMGNLAQYCQHIASQLPSLTVSYFFDHKKSVKKTENNFFQAVVKQLLEQTVYSQRYLDATPEAYRDSDTAPSDDRNQATQRLETLLNYVSERHKVFVVVDALDECDETEAATIVHFLRSLPATKRGGIRICLSSRAGLLQMQDEPCHHLDRNNAPEIAAFIKNQAAEFDNKQLHTGTITQSIIEEITRKASGIFLWARLSIRVLLNAYKRGEDLLEVLRSLPDDLESMFAAILDRIRKDTTELARGTMQILIWVLFAVRPLTITELRDVLIASVRKRSSFQVSGDNQLCPSSLTVREAPRYLFRAIESQCYGLVELQEDTSSVFDPEFEMGKKSKVMFIHDTVRDYLDSNLELLRPDAYITKSIRGTIHLECAEVSLQHLSACQDTHGNSEGDANLLTIFPFLNYATTCWIQHMIAAEREQLEVNELSRWLSRIYTTNPKHWLSSWLSVEKACCPPKEDIFDGSCTFLHVASYFGLTRLTEAYLRFHSGIFGLHSEIDRCDSSGRTSLCFAARAGHVQNVRLLLNAGANVALADHVHGQTALHVAAWAGHKDVTTILLEAGAEVKHMKNGTSILSGSAALGHCDVVEILLNKGFDPNSFDEKRGQSALSLALSNRHRQMVSLLIQHDADLDGKDVHTELTPLHHAIMSKDPTLVRKMLEAGARVPREPVSSLPVSQGLWVDRVMQMLLAESLQMTMPNRECPNASDKSKSGARNSSLPATSQCKTSSKASTKRSYNTSNEQNEEEGQELPPNKRPFLCPPPANNKDAMQLTLACPYLVFDNRQFRSMKCGQAGFPTIPLLKDHLREKHRILRCETCGLAFPMSDQPNRDLHQRFCIDEGFRNYADGYDQLQDVQVRKRLRNMPREEKWQFLYGVLFSSQNSITKPSPYFVPLFVSDLINIQNDHFQSSEFAEQLENVVSEGTAANITAARIADLLRRSSGDIISRYGRSLHLADAPNTILQPQPHQARQVMSSDQHNTNRHQPESLPTGQDDSNPGNLCQNPAKRHEQVEETRAPSVDSGYQSMQTVPTMETGLRSDEYNGSYDQNQQTRYPLQLNSSILRDPFSEVPATHSPMSPYQYYSDNNTQLWYQNSPLLQSNLDTTQFRPGDLASGPRQSASSGAEPQIAALSALMSGDGYGDIANAEVDEFDWATTKPRRYHGDGSTK